MKCPEQRSPSHVVAPLFFLALAVMSSLHLAWTWSGNPDPPNPGTRPSRGPPIVSDRRRLRLDLARSWRQPFGLFGTQNCHGSMQNVREHASPATSDRQPLEHLILPHSAFRKDGKAGCWNQFDLQGEGRGPFPLAAVMRLIFSTWLGRPKSEGG